MITLVIMITVLRYDWMRGIENAGKSLGMVAGRQQPTILPPVKYKDRSVNRGYQG